MKTNQKSKMKTKLTILLMSILCAMSVQAHELTFFGVVTSSTHPRFQPAPPLFLPLKVCIRVHYNPNSTNTGGNIQTYDISIGEIVQLRGVLGGGQVLVNLPVPGGTATFQAGQNISGASWFQATGKYEVPIDGSVPPLELWMLKNFVINIPPLVPTTSGVLTSTSIYGP
jgi:hypothetical protein